MRRRSPVTVGTCAVWCFWLALDSFVKQKRPVWTITLSRLIGLRLLSIQCIDEMWKIWEHSDAVNLLFSSCRTNRHRSNRTDSNVRRFSFLLLVCVARVEAKKKKKICYYSNWRLPADQWLVTFCCHNINLVRSGTWGKLYINRMTCPDVFLHNFGLLLFICLLCFPLTYFPARFTV